MADRGGEDLRAERRRRPARPEADDAAAGDGVGGDGLGGDGVGGVWSGRAVRVAAGLAVVLFGLLIWYAFDQKDQSLRDAPPPLITADPEPFKVPPEDPGGMPVPHRDKTVYSALAGKETAEVERLLPPPAEPRLPEGQGQDQGQNEERSEALRENPEVETAEVVKPEATSESPAEPESAKTAPQPEPTPEPVAEPEPAKAAPEPELEPEPAPEPVESTSPPLKQVYTADDIADRIDGFKIQLGAFRDRATAKQGWETVRTRHKDLAAGLKPAIVKAEVKNKGTFYRLQAGPVDDMASARALCEKFKSSRLGCFPVGP